MSRKHARALCTANARLERRAHALSQQLLTAVPSQAYYVLLEKYHAALSQRRDVALSATAALSAGGAQLDASRTLAELQQRYSEACARAAAAEEAARIGDVTRKCAGGATDATAELAADLRQRAVEVEAARQEAGVAERRAARLQVDAQEALQQLSDLREAHGRQAKRASNPAQCAYLGWGHMCRMASMHLCSCMHVASHSLLRAQYCALLQSSSSRAWRRRAFAASSRLPRPHRCQRQQKTPSNRLLNSTRRRARAARVRSQMRVTAPSGSSCCSRFPWQRRRRRGCGGGCRCSSTRWPQGSRASPGACCWRATRSSRSFARLRSAFASQRRSRGKRWRVPRYVR